MGIGSSITFLLSVQFLRKEQRVKEAISKEKSELWQSPKSLRKQNIVALLFIAVLTKTRIGSANILFIRLLGFRFADRITIKRYSNTAVSNTSFAL